jgi:hypothetical protein
MWEDGFFSACFIVTYEYYEYLLLVELVDGDRLALRVLRLADGGWGN